MALPGSGEIVCTHCPAGQRGRLCDLCDDGFFGDPLGRNGPTRSCSPCSCNGNVDPNAVGNCDPVSGHCLRCLYNTTGEYCERCQEGFYGDPLAASPARKCSPCKCNPGGSIHGLEACHSVTGQCPCLPHVTGRDCSQCQEGHYALQTGIGCKSCKCHPVGSQHSHCHPLTGQCVCLSGVEGLSCDRCQAGFFGFSFQGCRACNCSHLGSLSLQCHENSTCTCKRGFVGYKCDQCEENYVFDPESSQCKECPICYSLVKEEASKLRDQLATMEWQLQKPDCGRNQAHYALLREDPWGDSIHSRYLRKGAKVTFLEEAEELESFVSRAWSQLRNVSGVMGCHSNEGTKRCILFSDILSALKSTQQEIRLGIKTLAAAMEFPPESSHQPTNWSHQALESKLLARSHGEAAALVEDIARRALLTSNTSYLLLQSILMDNRTLEFRRQMEERYQRIQKAQQELDCEMEKAAAFASSQQINLEISKNLSWIPTLELRPLLQQVENLSQDAKELEQLVESKAQQAANGSLVVQTGLEVELQRMQQLGQVWQKANSAHLLATSSVSNGEAVVSDAKTLLANLEGMKKHKGNQFLVKRRMTVVQERVITDAQKKARQARRILGNSASASAKARETAREVESLAKENAKKVQAIFRDAKEENKHAGKLRTRVDSTLAETVRQEQESEDLRRKQEGAGQVRMEMNDLDKSIRDAQNSLERDIARLNDLLLSLGKMDHTTQTEAALNATQLQLEHLQLRLAASGVVGQKLSTLQQEAEQQRQRIKAFEKDLEEIQSDRRNLEAILQSLPEACSSWQ